VRAQLELVADCSACRVEGALVELYDPAVPACAYGLPAEARCIVCGAAWEGALREGPGSRGVRARASGRCPCCDHSLLDDELAAHACGQCGSRAVLAATRAGADLRDAAVLRAAMEALAAAEGATLADYLDANFMGRTLEEVRALIARGDAVETTFDAMFSLFSRGAGRSVNLSAKRAQAQRPPSAHAPRPSLPPAAPQDPRAILLALVSVLVADGQTDPRETAFIDGFLRREGLAALEPQEWVVHRPVEVAGRIPAARRAEVVELMTQLACVDGHADPSELRVVESYAAAWQIPREDIDAWVERYRHQYAGDVRRFVRRLRSFFVRPRDDP
jgi:uncharacterized tellurite resistance protein B-like protein